MKLIYLFLGLAALLILIPALRLPKSFLENERKRKLVRKKMREQARQKLSDGE